MLCEGSVDVKLINYYDYKDIKPKNENRYNGDEFMESV